MTYQSCQKLVTTKSRTDIAVDNTVSIPRSLIKQAIDLILPPRLCVIRQRHARCRKFIDKGTKVRREQTADTI